MLSIDILRNFSGSQKIGQEMAVVTANMFVRDLELNAVNDFDVLVQNLRAAEMINTINFGRGIVESISAQNIKSMAEKLLAENSLAFVKNDKEVEQRILLRKEKERSNVVNVAILGSSNLDLAKNTLENTVETDLPDRKVNVYVLPFGQLEQGLLDPDSDYNTDVWDLTIFANRLEDLAQVSVLAMSNTEQLEHKVDEYIELIIKVANKTGNKVIVHEFAFVQNFTIAYDQKSQKLIQTCNLKLREKLDLLNNVYLVSLEPIINSVELSFDYRLWYIGKFRFHLVLHKN